MINSASPRKTQKFLNPYISNQVKKFNKKQSDIPVQGMDLYDGLLYRIPEVVKGANKQVFGLNRLFEKHIRENEAIWRDLLGTYSTTQHARQTEACSLVIQAVAEEGNKNYFMLPAYFACGLLLWLHLVLLREQQMHESAGKKSHLRG